MSFGALVLRQTVLGREGSKVFVQYQVISKVSGMNKGDAHIVTKSEGRKIACPTSGEKPVGEECDMVVNDSVEVNKQDHRKFVVVDNLSHKEMAMLKYLCSKKARAEDCLQSAAVGRCREFTISRWDLLCLVPRHCINSKVINIMGEYCFAKRDKWWFMSTIFSDRAKYFSDHYKEMDLFITATITMCKLRNYYGRLHACTKIFVPVEDKVDNHWFLLVKITDYECEIWDSIPDEASHQRRMHYVNNVLTLLSAVFGYDRSSTSVYPSTLSSFTFTYPNSGPTNTNKYDSGIFTIRHMQYYRQPWFCEFDSADQRVSIALEIVNNPMNDCYNLFWDAVCREQTQRGTRGR